MKKRIFGIILAMMVAVSILAIPEIENLSSVGQRCLAVFSAVFILYLFESIHVAIISLLIVPILVIFQITDIHMALKGFSSTSTYLIIGSFVMAAAMLKSNLGDRITYWVLVRVGSSAKRISFGIMCVNIVMAFLIPSSTARTAMLLPICIKMIHLFRDKEQRGGRFGANLLMTLCCTNSTISAGILTSTVTNPMAVQYIASVTGQTVSFVKWLEWGFPPALLMTIVSWVLIQLIFSSKINADGHGREYFQQKLNELGTIRKSEKNVFIIFLGTILLWIFGENFGLDSTTVCLLSACILCLPKVGCLDWKECQASISLNVVFVCSGGISLGAAMSDTGAANWLADSIFSLLHLSQYSAAATISILLVIVQFMHVVFVGTATMANVFFPILVGIAEVSNINPMLTVLPAAFMIGGYPILMFFNTTPNILCCDTGELKNRDFPLFGCCVSILACIVYIVCVYWYWPLIHAM
ncbi:SLC13 family permease [Anaerosinus massiliensis]|uniref:SLC13 family permease n=1 Tax=Massilibacillus massiliensis TaxID=1806837 RepID=UPI000A6C1194|nr:DASS family sodium-coupled anion symporter [Massilibacillus massiliensis]